MPNNPDHDNELNAISQMHLDLSIDEVLASTFTKFFKGYGVFVKTDQEFNLGDRIKVSLTIPDDPELYEVDMQVIWIVPQNAEDRRAQGIGLAPLQDPANHDEDSGFGLMEKISYYLTNKDREVHQELAQFSTFPFP